MQSTVIKIKPKLSSKVLIDMILLLFSPVTLHKILEHRTPITKNVVNDHPLYLINLPPTTKTSFRQTQVGHSPENVDETRASKPV
jgi:hypothetical protein